MAESDKYIDKVIELVKEVTVSNAAQTASIEALRSTVSEEINQTEGSTLEAIGDLSDRLAVLENKKSCVFDTEDFKQVKENFKKVLTEETYDLLGMIRNTKRFITFVSILLALLATVLTLAGAYSLFHGFFNKGG